MNVSFYMHLTVSLFGNFSWNLPVTKIPGAKRGVHVVLYYTLDTVCSFRCARLSNSVPRFLEPHSIIVDK